MKQQLIGCFVAAIILGVASAMANAPNTPSKIGGNWTTEQVVIPEKSCLSQWKWNYRVIQKQGAVPNPFQLLALADPADVANNSALRYVAATGVPRTPTQPQADSPLHRDPGKAAGISA